MLICFGVTCFLPLTNDFSNTDVGTFPMRAMFPLDFTSFSEIIKHTDARTLLLNVKTGF